MSPSEMTSVQDTHAKKMMYYANEVLILLPMAVRPDNVLLTEVVT